jgi:hypothetical protein
MNIIAHRGNVAGPNPQKANSIDFLLDALKKGYGIETDIRDMGGDIVISHDLPVGEPPEFAGFLSRLPKLGKGQALALNIKADGMHKLLEKMMGSHRAIGNTFFFDMSVPTLYVLSKTLRRENLASRVSDIEPEPMLYDSVGWLWIDCFAKDFDDWARAKKYAMGGKKLAFVSPDLHKRPHVPFWKELKENFPGEGDIHLCTDYAEEASRFFAEG